MTGASDRSMTVAVVIVNWNTKELVDECLSSVARYAPPSVRMELVLVDNGSTDGSADHIRRAWPAVRLIDNPDNRGFARATNQGIHASVGEFVLLLNSDAQLTAGCLEQLLAAMMGEPRRGAAGARLTSPTGRWQRTAAGRSPSLGTLVNHYLFLERLLPTLAIFKGLYLIRDTRRSQQVDWVSGACMLLRRAALDEVGLLDERYFMYMDDVDLCDRLSAAGWSVAYVPAATAMHREGHSSLNSGNVVKLGAIRSLHRYFEQRHGPRRLAALRAIQVVGYGSRSLMLALAGTFGRDPRLRARASANLAYMRFAGGMDRVPARPNSANTKHREARS